MHRSRDPVSIDRRYYFFYVVPTWVKNFHATIKRSSLTGRAKSLRFFVIKLDVEPTLFASTVRGAVTSGAKRLREE